MIIKQASIIDTGCDRVDTSFAPAPREPLTNIIEHNRIFGGSHVFKSIMDHLPIALLVLNQQRQIIYGNNFTSKLLGRKVEDLMGSRPGEVFLCRNAWASHNGCGTSTGCRDCGAVNAILESLDTGKIVFNECRISQEDASALNLKVWAYPIVINQQTYVVVAALDVSDLKQRQFMEKIFFHDILNTAGGIQGYLKKLIIEQEKQSNYETSLDTVYGLTQALIGEITSQKKILSAESNSSEANRDIVDSISLMNEVKSLYENHEITAGRQIDIKTNAFQVQFVSDMVLLHRILGNMLKNALEASRPGDRVSMSCEQDEQDIVFSVHNPTFMPESVQNQVFQKSFSTKGEGRGLGTYSMKLLSKRYLDGDVSFKTHQTQGTTFYARYPLKVVEKIKVSTDKIEPIKLTEKISVLLVDDSEINLEIAKFLFEEAGCEVEVAGSGFEALDRLKQAEFDAVFIDLNMPEMTGIELKSHIKADANLAHIFLIVMTADVAGSNRDPNFGFDDRFPKPFDIRNVDQFVEKWNQNRSE